MWSCRAYTTYICHTRSCTPAQLTPHQLPTDKSSPDHHHRSRPSGPAVGTPDTAAAAMEPAVPCSGYPAPGAEVQKAVAVERPADPTGMADHHCRLRSAGCCTRSSVTRRSVCVGGRVERRGQYVVAVAVVEEERMRRSLLLLAAAYVVAVAPAVERRHRSS